MNKQVSDNFAKVRLWHFALAVGVFALFLGALKLFGLSEIQAYPHIQKDIFFSYQCALFTHSHSSAQFHSTRRCECVSCIVVMLCAHRTKAVGGTHR